MLIMAKLYHIREDCQGWRRAHRYRSDGEMTAGR